MIRKMEKRKRKGVVMMMFTMMMLFVILPAVGLAVDAGVMFAVKAKMQAAADGAALSAARSLSRGLAFQDQQASATRTAVKFYRINIENGWLGLNAQADPVVTFPTLSLNSMTVRIDLTVSAPTYFMRVLGPETLTMRSRSEVTRRFVNLVLVLDRSGSLQQSGSCPTLISASTEFTKMYMNGTDRLSLVTFGTTYRNDFPLANDFLSRSGGNDMPSLIGGIHCAGGTNSASAYMTGVNQLIASGQPGALNVIVFFTDGQPTALHLPQIPIKSTSGCSNKGSRNGVVVEPTLGISIPIETNPPSTVPSLDYQRPVDSGQGTINPSNPSKSGCAFASNMANVENDISQMTPSGSSNFLDAFGNSLLGPYSVSTSGSGSSQYISFNDNNIDATSRNALVNAAVRGRQLSAANNTNIVTYTIGLGNTSAPPDSTLLNRIANDVDSSAYDATYAPGSMIYAANLDELNAAFARLASEILRIAM